MLQPGSVLSRTLAVALLGIAVLGAYRLIVAPLLTAYRDGEARIEQAKDLLQRYEALAQQRSLLTRPLAEQQERAASAAGYLQGPSDALAAAQLQDRVKSVVEAAGGELRSTQILPAEQLECRSRFPPHHAARPLRRDHRGFGGHPLRTRRRGNHT